jgi:hypothetical protein
VEPPVAKQKCSQKQAQQPGPDGATLFKLNRLSDDGINVYFVSSHYVRAAAESLGRFFHSSDEPSRVSAKGKCRSTRTSSRRVESLKHRNSSRS